KEDKRILRKDLLPYWKGKTAIDKIMNVLVEQGLAKMPKVKPNDLIESVRCMGLSNLHKLVKDAGILPLIKMSGKLPAYIAANLNPAVGVLNFQGHVLYGHDKVIQQGFNGIKEKAKNQIRKLNPDNADDRKKIQFYEAVTICCDASIAFTQRFAEKAILMAEKETDPTRKAELLTIAENCRWVPANPARNFYEAMQSFWFSKVILEIYHPMSTISMGRVDQYLYPFYEKDIKNGTITSDKAQELIEELYLKIQTCTLYLGPAVTPSYNLAGYQAFTIGGVDSEGKDVTNELSYLFLDALVYIKPVINLCVRTHRNTPKEFLMKVGEAIAKGANFALYNDEIYIEALHKWGCSLEDARNYGIIGCVEQVSAGNTGGNTGASLLNLVGVLDLTLNNGVGSPMYQLIGNNQGLATGDTTKFTSFDEFMDAFKKQLKSCMKHLVASVNVVDGVYSEIPTPYISATIDDCMDNGTDIVNGGGHYDVTVVDIIGTANVANSLAAIKKLVFEEKKLTMAELIKLIHTNFRGKENIRQMIINRVPKYGNDDDYVDSIAREVMDFVCHETQSYNNI
ncbi:MAG: hypothetical protein CVU88_08230, partial [Firmicutes bacterium HGW-Firmicutes-13]